MRFGSYLSCCTCQNNCLQIAFIVKGSFYANRIVLGCGHAVFTAGKIQHLKQLQPWNSGNIGRTNEFINVHSPDDRHLLGYDQDFQYVGTAYELQHGAQHSSNTADECGPKDSKLQTRQHHTAYLEDASFIMHTSCFFFCVPEAKED